MSTEHEQVAHEDRVFADLIEDILQATSGLNYHVHQTEPQSDGDDVPYAIFTIEANPAHDLTVSIELARGEFRLRVNGDAFVHPMENRRRIDRWIDRRCRDVEHLVSGDLKLEVETVLGRYLSSDLYAGSKKDWKWAGDRDDGWGWIGILGWLLPFGLSPMRTHEVEYTDWFLLDQEPMA